MENKNVGYILLGICALIIIVILMFNSALKEIVSTSCGAEHSIVCPMNRTVNQQTYISLGIVGILIMVSLVLIFAKPDKEVIIRTRTVKKPNVKIDKSELNFEEKKVLDLVESNKAIFQADLIEKTGYGKAKITRILDRIEGKGFVERKRRGMTNVVVMKEK